MIAGFCFVAGFLAAYVVMSLQEEKMAYSSDTFSLARDNHWTNPLLACADLPELSLGKMKHLKETIQEIIKDRTEKQRVTHVSVYVRDLNNGPWLAIEEDALFYPASLLKVPILIMAYKMEEDTPGFLDTPVTFTEVTMGEVVQDFPPQETLTLGSTYTLRELTRRMIVHSDNEAMNLVASYLGPELNMDVFSYFGIEKPSVENEFRIKVRTYASFFRVLYNASFLNLKHSEEALGFLAETDFVWGLEAGLPADVPVAHKFGERRYINEGAIIQNEPVQVHDCGIVYAKSPYLICVMVEGHVTDEITSTIRDISKTVYDAIGR